MRLAHVFLTASLLAASAMPALAEPKEADDADVARFVSEAVSATLTRGGEGTDAAWLNRMVSVTSTDGANSVLRFWAGAGVPDEPSMGESYAAQVSGSPDVRHMASRTWRARAIVLQTYERGTERGANGLQVEAMVRQDAKSGALQLDSIAMRE